MFFERIYSTEAVKTEVFFKSLKKSSPKGSTREILEILNKMFSTIL